ncbi:hypothetical protein [Amycolatopsis aidingensis]|uniref:hypothetical protein n=1 Tax=Amycolatopsis aidingensis TaxID=2842453 RepID=UPI001C0B6B57|nr:hypothetical protein [Amycolatopsis aidingensis]
MSDLSLDVQTVRLSAMYEGMNSTGFTGLLTPIGDGCEAARTNLLQPMFEMLQRKLNQTGEGVRTAAYKYGLAEVEAQERVEGAGKGGARAI